MVAVFDLLGCLLVCVFVVGVLGSGSVFLWCFAGVLDALPVFLSLVGVCVFVCFFASLVMSKCVCVYACLGLVWSFGWLLGWLVAWVFG